MHVPRLQGWTWQGFVKMLDRARLSETRLRIKYSTIFEPLFSSTSYSFHPILLEFVRMASNLVSPKSVTLITTSTTITNGLGVETPTITIITSTIGKSTSQSITLITLNTTLTAALGRTTPTFTVITSTISQTTSQSSPELSFAPQSISRKKTSPNTLSASETLASATKPNKPTQPANAATSHGSSSADQTHGLSTGASIGIGIAIAVFVLGVLCALGFFWYRRRSRRRRGDDGAVSHRPHGRKDARTTGGGPQKNKVSKLGDAGVSSPYELSGKSRTGELETDANRHELDANRRAERRHELPGDHGYRR